MHDDLAPRLALLDSNKPVRSALEREDLGVDNRLRAAGREETA